MVKVRTLLLPLLAATLSGCFPLPRPVAKEAERPRTVAESTVEMRESPSRPRIALLARGGDPNAAIGLAVATEGNAAEAVALAAIVESRLGQQGYGRLRVSASRDGFQLEAWVADPTEAAALISTIRGALLTPLSEGSGEVLHARARLQRLRSQPHEATLGSIAGCTGELALSPADLDSALFAETGVAALEALRRRTHVTSRMAFSAVGQPSIGEAAALALARTEPWPSGPPASPPWPKEDEVAVETSQASAHARVTVALRVGDARDAMWAAERAGRAEGPLVGKLGGLPAPFRLVEVSATTQSRGGCLAATVEIEQSLGEGFEPVAAEAARIVESELRAELSEAKELPTFPDPWRRARETTDPREAAGLTAWWSLAMPAPSEPIRRGVAASLPASKASRRAAEKRFRDALVEYERDARARSVEQRVRVERGQHRLWLLVASPCALLSESSSDAGITALSLLSAAARTPTGDVSLEPWNSADGVGLLAHATRRPNESAEELASRIANEAARALVFTARSPVGFPKARSMLLSRLAREDGSEGSALELAAEALSPSHLSFIAPRGSFDSAARLGAEAIALRIDSFLAGPLRVAVLADEATEQGEIAARTVERWLSGSPKKATHCSQPSARIAATPGLVTVELPKGVRSARAIVGFPAPASGERHRESLELAATALNGGEGLLAQALRSLEETTATARAVGGSLAPSLLVDLRAPDDRLDAALAQIRALFGRLAEGALSEEAFARAIEAHREATLASSFDPRRRIVDLWLGDASPSASAPPSLEALQSFARATFDESRAVIVIARPRSL